MLWGLFGKKKKEGDLVDFLVMLEKEWSRSWQKFVEENGGINQKGGLPCHALAMFVLTICLPDNKTRDILHERFCKTVGLTGREKMIFLEQVSEVYSRLFPAYNMFVRGSGGGAVLASAIHRELFPGDAGGVTEMLSFGHFMEQQKATLEALKKLDAQSYKLP